MSDPLSLFEKDMSALVQSLQRFEPDPSIASSIVHDSDLIADDIKQLKSITESYRNFDTSEREYDMKLTHGLKDALNILVECKRELDQLPKSPTTSGGDATSTISEDDQDTKEILSYALKLAKFSKIPRTFDGFLLPNNFIWPGDDNMRRGNLALASLMPEKIIQLENFGPGYVSPKAEAIEAKADAGDDQRMDVDNDSEDDFIPERSSFNEGHTKPDSTSIMAGLDLLDSDDE
ncbi:hypothetical protein CAS74_002655 [Pichia kudriavzevii]|mgnify:CR=1 FL=1|uniref:Mediator of RNA polymerase II transcription subunit 4 n=1 Tax=Pichia kudriavzevii TaxID=4909 RepID=A0A1V2LJB1_PICKU|nr:uncharacterized protein C5L36_0E05780 [Pichia kudriavzevii]AWU78524.1 hypothetical protein C5L36_0E05780 [Pichia kudriavzevii]ONH72241.1 Mediator of RNA polymerase II transcription subunit 4 [Pichia kudriavzevii]OUT21687.1 hypothetical protein CAS74_002655 [Pichia kudriavzevii]